MEGDIIDLHHLRASHKKIALLKKKDLYYIERDLAAVKHFGAIG